MAVKIRLSRIGKKNAPMYRIVAIDSRKKRDGMFIEDLGTYNPSTGQLVTFQLERVNDWIAKGAIPTETVSKLRRLYLRQQRALNR